ncbi:putative gag protein [Burkholderia pseudomallei MSHR5609]|nr:putative gag protein [Burkholderia pseudomallei MSHR5609]
MTYAQLAKSSRISARPSHHMKHLPQCLDFIGFLQVRRLRAI